MKATLTFEDKKNYEAAEEEEEKEEEEEEEVDEKQEKDNSVRVDPAPQNVEGFLLKEGVRGLTKGWKRRWFHSQENRLNYYNDRGDQDPIGVITLVPGSKFIQPSNESNKNVFVIETPKRTYRLQVV